MYDYAEVTKIPVNVSVQSAEVRRLALQRMDVMQRELRHAQVAFTALRHALTAPVPSSRPLADAVMNSRNWLVSVVSSYTYIQAMMETAMPPSMGAGVENISAMPRVRELPLRASGGLESRETFGRIC